MKNVYLPKVENSFTFALLGSKTEFISAILAMLMVLSMTFAISAEETKTYKLSDMTENAEGLKVTGEYFYVKKAMDYFGIKNVDLTGVKSISVDALIGMNGTNNGQI